MTEIGIRALREDLAAVVRRAGSGDTTVITVDGKPIAQLAPLGAPEVRTLAQLVAAGLLEPPGRHDKPDAPEAAVLPVDVRADRILDEIRG